MSSRVSFWILIFGVWYSKTPKFWPGERGLNPLMHMLLQYAFYIGEIENYDNFGRLIWAPFILLLTYLLIVVQDYSAWCNCKCHFISIFGLVLRPCSTCSGCRVWWYTIWLYCARARRHGHCAACREGPPRAGTTKKQLLHVPSSHYKVADSKCMWWRSNSNRIYY